MRRSRLFRALLSRELDVFLVILVIAATAGAVLAARTAITLNAAGTELTLLDRMIVRYGVTLLVVAMGVMLVRLASRPADDHVGLWLDPYCATGGSRTAYGLFVAFSVWVAGLTLFALPAVTYALSVRYLDGTSELVLGLPTLLTGGAISLACFAAYGTLASMLLRNSPGSMLLSTLAWAAPLVLAARYLLARDAVPLWVRWWLRAVPPTSLPATLMEIARAIVYAAVVATLLAASSWLLAGRRS